MWIVMVCPVSTRMGWLRGMNSGNQLNMPGVWVCGTIDSITLSSTLSSPLLPLLQAVCVSNGISEAALLPPVAVAEAARPMPGGAGTRGGAGTAAAAAGGGGTAGLAGRRLLLPAGRMRGLQPGVAPALAVPAEATAGGVKRVLSKNPAIPCITMSVSLTKDKCLYL